jgi:hypothetical protein
VGSTDPVGDLNNADAIVVAEGYATAATLKSLHAETGDPLGRVAFVAAFDAGNVPHVARVLRERHLSAAMVIAADNDRAMEGQEVGRNPGLIKGQEAAAANGAVLMAPSFSAEELEAGFSDWNDLATHDEGRKDLVAKELEQALQKAFALQSTHQSSVSGTGKDHGNNQNISSGVNTAGDHDEEETQAAWSLSSGDLHEEQNIPPIDRDPRSQWDFRIGTNGVIEHFRTDDGRVAVRETGDKIEILDQDHDSMERALERAVERFGGYLHFDGNPAGARTLVDIVVTHDLAVTFTDDQLNAQIQLRRTQNGLDRGHSIATSEPAQTPAQKRSADASGLTPERKAAVQPDGQVASQQTGEVFVDCGAARFNFDEKNDLNYFVRTITPQGEQRIYWGKDFPRALEEAEAKVGESITATRVASKPVTVEEIQEQPDGSRQTVRIDAKRGQWQVDNLGVNREALIKAYDVLVKSPEDRKTLEQTAPLLVSARDQAVVELKREKLAAELNQRNLKNHTVRRR